MNNKKIPLRTCIISHERLPKKELIRIVKDNLGNINIDITGKMNGHGVYIKRDNDILDRAIKTKILEKYLETSISNEIYDEIRNIINN